MKAHIQNFNFFRKNMSEQNAITIEKIRKLKEEDLDELCEATEETIKSTPGFSIGFHQSGMLKREYLKAYFRGVLMIPERELYIGRLGGVIAGSIQLAKPSVTNQTSSFACAIDNHFVAPWARGHGLALKLLESAENDARTHGYMLMKLSVRATRNAAISLYRKSGYIHWGTLEKYEIMGGEIVPGLFFYKDL